MVMQFMYIVRAQNTRLCAVADNPTNLVMFACSMKFGGLHNHMAPYSAMEQLFKLKFLWLVH